jgi:hypothetical protein
MEENDSDLLKKITQHKAREKRNLLTTSDTHTTNIYVRVQMIFYSASIFLKLK